MSARAGRAEAARLAGAVRAVEYHRLLGLPRRRELQGALAERAAWARDWYARHGRPELRVRRFGIRELGVDMVQLEAGPRLASGTLAARLRHCRAHALVVMAATAGAEVGPACAERWRDGRPDEAWFLDRFAAAVVEHLVWSVMRGDLRSLARAGEALAGHLSPGCGSWDLGEQRLLRDALFAADEPAAVTVLDSGALAPSCSQFAVAGVIRAAGDATVAERCHGCDLAACHYRRAAWRPLR